MIGDLPRCPFPGPASYDYDRREAFFGRDDEAVLLCAMMLSQPTTVLTAGSGDGKTSLLHAGIAPLLFHRGIEVCIAEPGGTDPLREIGETLLERLLPPTDTSADVLQLIVDRIGRERTLKEARECCHEMSFPERQKLLVPTQFSGSGDALSRPVNLFRGGPLSTWLRDKDVPDGYLLSALQAAAGITAHAKLGTEWRLVDLIAYLRQSTARSCVSLHGPPEEVLKQLLGAVEKGIRRRREADEDFELILVIDQFEEIFAQFRAGFFQTPSDRTAPRRHQDALFDFIRKIRGSQWPIRLVLSLRKEHYADLQVAMDDPEGVASATYHLAPLTSQQARECLFRPRQWPSRSPTEEQVTSVIAALSGESISVAPILLSVVGEWLWLDETLLELSPQDLQKQVPSAIGVFVKRVFDTPDEDGHVWNVPDRQEALDILEQLVVHDGKSQNRKTEFENNIVDLPLRNSERRAQILDELIRRRLVRRDQRLGRREVDLVHETVIEALSGMRSEIARTAPEVSALPELIKHLRAVAQSRTGVRVPLSRALRGILSANLDRIVLPPAMAARTLTRLLLASDLLSDEQGNTAVQSKGIRSRVSKVIQKLADDASRSDDRSSSDAPTRIENDQWVGAEEADRVCNERGLALGAEFATLALGSAMYHRDRGAANRIRFFGRRLRDRDGR